MAKLRPRGVRAPHCPPPESALGEGGGVAGGRADFRTTIVSSYFRVLTVTALGGHVDPTPPRTLDECQIGSRQDPSTISSTIGTFDPTGASETTYTRRESPTRHI